MTSWSNEENIDMDIQLKLNNLKSKSKILTRVKDPGFFVNLEGFF